MPGIYIHIPYCKKACHYCNFHFSTTLHQKSQLVEALCTEITMREAYLPNEPLQTIYFGGGTPSLLEVKELHQILNTIDRTFSIASQLEVTLECNPDDITLEKAQSWKAIGINRLSIGVQSFHEDHLQWMNRGHSANEAIDCLKIANRVGYQSFSIDLIYGYQLLTEQQWMQNLQIALQYQVPHISAYALTVEPKTPLAHFVRHQKYIPLEEALIIKQMNLAISTFNANGYSHYEISNFAKEGAMAVHNTNYWRGEKYLGIGPSAHSYNQESRQWNVANNPKYIKSVLAGRLPSESETLSKMDHYNEYVMVSLRTQWGIQKETIRQRHASFELHLKNQIAKYQKSEWIVEDPESYRLTTKGKAFADAISADLFAD